MTTHLRPDAYSTLAGLDLTGDAPVTYVARRSADLLDYLLHEGFVTVYEAPSPITEGTTRHMMKLTDAGRQALIVYRNE